MFFFIAQKNSPLSPQKNSKKFLWELWGLCFYLALKKTKFFWGLKKLVILRGAPVEKSHPVAR